MAGDAPASPGSDPRGDLGRRRGARPAGRSVSDGPGSGSELHDVEAAAGAGANSRTHRGRAHVRGARPGAHPRGLRDRSARTGRPRVPHSPAGLAGGGSAGAEPRGVERRVIQLTPQMRILVAVERVDFRKGIDSLARVCAAGLGTDPFSGAVFVFQNRRETAIKLLAYDGQGFWLAQKRLSSGRFRWWPTSATAAATLEAHQLQRLIMAGDPAAADAAPMWRRVQRPA